MRPVASHYDILSGANLVLNAIEHLYESQEPALAWAVGARVRP